MSDAFRVRAKYSKENDVTLFAGDCLALLKQLPNASVRLVMTSPPYNVGKSYEQRVALDAYIEGQRAVIKECVRVLTPGGSIAWQVGPHITKQGQILPLDLLLHPVFAENVDLRLRNRIIWHYAHGLHASRRFSGRHEAILWYTRGEEYTFNLDSVRIPQKYPGKRAYKGPRKGEFSGHPLGKNPGDVWVFPNVKGSHVEKTIHPCQFPVELAERLVLALTDPGELVVDPYVGVGTTAVAAAMHGRQAAGADLVREYVEIAKDRLRSLGKGTLKFRPKERPVEEPVPNTPLTRTPPHFRLVK
jgi:adenine-specific DNA-methyltransferase